MNRTTALPTKANRPTGDDARSPGLKTLYPPRIRRWQLAPILAAMLVGGPALGQDVPASRTSAPETQIGYQLRQASYPPGLSQLVGISGQQGATTIAVQVHLQGKGVGGQGVEFRIVGTPSSAGGAKLSARKVVTDADGRAETRLTAGADAGTYLVGAYLHGKVEPVEPVMTRVQIMTPGWLMFLVFGLLGGLGLFLYGMTLAGDNLQKVAGNQIRALIRKLTRNRFSGVLVGTVASGVLQSSSAATVMLVGFVSATLMTLTQAISVMMGAKVGVTITVQIIAFNLSDYALGIIGIGAVLIMAAGKRDKMKGTGAILLGFGLLFFGLSLMSGAMKPLRGMPEFTDLLLSFGSSPALAIIVGTLFTAVIQSSAATVAMSMALAAEGLLPVEAAIPIAIGAAIGTCATALLASISATRDGKRVAVAHLLFSVAGAVLVYPFMDSLVDLTRLFTRTLGSSGPVREIANGFMLYSCAATLAFLPFVSLLERAVMWLIPPAKQEAPFGPKYINAQALAAPLMALDQAQREVERMAELLDANLRAAVPAILAGNREQIQQTAAADDQLDILEKAIRPFLAQVAQKGLSDEDAARERALVYITEDLEGAGDLLTKEVLHAGAKLAAAGHSFSAEGAEDIARFHAKIVEKSGLVQDAVRNRDRTLAERVLQLSFKEKQLERRLRDAHLERLHAGGEQTLQSSADHLSILAGLAALAAKLDRVAEEILREM